MSAEVDPLSQSVVIRSLRRFREKYFPSSGKGGEDEADLDSSEETSQLGLLDILPVDLQFMIMTFLSPVDICRLGASSRYWRAMVRDPLLWRFFLLRDMPTWTSIDHMTMPQLESLDAPLIKDGDSEDDTETTAKPDYMAEYLRACPSCRQRWLPSRPTYQILTSFLQSLVPATEPRFAMFGPGMEQLDVSLVTTLMHSPHILPVSGTPHRQINGIGSGISYVYKERHKFNILTLYSTNRAERERAKMQKQYLSDKLFICEGNDSVGRPVYSPAPQLQQVCEVVNGFIYVANAEPWRDERASELPQIQAVLRNVRDSAPRPLLVLSCISTEEPPSLVSSSTSKTGRIYCIDMARRLGLSQLDNPWMVQDTVAETLSGLLDGISWLLRCSGVNV
ncbi:F-box only protein 4 isoform X1 [Synchiropus splendidus]|uniref:F-box only protein 4 isoform X1 n=2 Tax=Synchiropus splendidus TaxID=270530 RepID=UPI00237DDDA4|nr:F-box only protein 4 isoform X1 [Synchiropus splendidus]